jgi:uncharacterized damage-inducible protein DinB
MTFREQLLIEFDDEVKKTRRMLECVPDGNFAWKPHEKSMTLGRLSGHLAELPGRSVPIIRMDTLVRQPGYMPFSATSSSELMEKFAKESAEGRSAIESLQYDDLQAIWTLKLGDRTVWEMPRWSALRTVCMNHMIHHRAQLGVYLRLLDVHIPGTYGPSADEKL